MNERRVNATYRYIIDLKTKKIEFFEERYNYMKNNFTKGKDLTDRYYEYLKSLNKK